MTTTPIASFTGEFRFLSNFYQSPVSWAMVLYPTVEHAYQAAKTLDPQERLQIYHAATPGQAKRLGQTVTLRRDWDQVKVGIMRELLYQKFDGPLAARLLATGERELIEGNWWGDRFWGRDLAGVGENWLGKLLMEVRDALRRRTT